ncbi:MAG: hypothetical protein ACRC46_12575 [Thermoguttaceae bacterium]
MTETRREKLLGYILDALEDDERDAIDCEVAASPALHNELTELVGELQPLSVLKGYYSPADNAELVARTCNAVWQHADEAVEEEAVVEESTVEDESKVEDESNMTYRSYETEAAPIAETAPITEAAPTPKLSPPASCPAPRVSRRTNRAASPAAPQPPHVRWASRVVSVTVGVLIAVLMFPAFTFVKDKVVARVCQVFMLDVEANMEYYKQLQENNAIVRAREPSGSLRTGSSQWHTLAQHTAPIASGAVTPTPEMLDEIPPLKIAFAQDSVASLFSGEQPANSSVNDDAIPIAKSDNLRILADPKPASSQGPRLYPFQGNSIFISGDNVYYRFIPTR